MRRLLLLLALCGCSPMDEDDIYIPPEAGADAPVDAAIDSAPPDAAVEMDAMDRD